MCTLVMVPEDWKPTVSQARYRIVRSYCRKLQKPTDTVHNEWVAPEAEASLGSSTDNAVNV